MYRVGHERRERCEQPARDGQHLMQGGERRAIVSTVNFIKPGARLSHVPLGHILVHELHHAPRRKGGVVLVEMRIHLRFDPREARQNPAIERGAIGDGGIVRARAPAEVGILRKNAVVHVAEGEQKTPRRFADRVLVETTRHPHLTGGHQEQTHRIGTMALEHLPRIDGVALALGHLLTLRIEHQVIHDHMAIRGSRAIGVVGQCVTQPGRDRDQRVEPTACLVDAFADEVGGKLRFDLVVVFERIMPLREGHRARVEPGVDHFRHAAHGAGPRRGWPRVLIDVRLVRIEVVGERTSDTRRQIGVAADHVDLGGVFVVHPDRQRRAPVAVARNRPIHVIRQPLTEAAGADFARVPVDGGIPRHQALAHRGRAHEPRTTGVVQQRCAAAPAMRIRVREGSRFPQHVAFAQHVDDAGIGLLHEHAAHLRHVVGELAARRDRLQEGEPMTLTGRVVVGTERRRHVHHAAAVFRAHEIFRHDHFMTTFIGIRHPVERSAIALARQFRAGHLSAHVPAVGPVGTQHSRHPCLGQNDRPLGARLLAQLHVRERGIHRQRGVRHQRPRRGRPHQNATTLRRRVALLVEQIERHVHTRVFDVVVPLRHFVTGQRGATARAIGQDLVPAHQQRLFVQRAQRPPHRLHEVVRVGDVRVVVIEPVRRALRQLLPITPVPEHAFAAATVEFRHAGLFDQLLATKLRDLRCINAQARGFLTLQFFLDFDFDRQAVRIPSGLARYEIPLHRAVAAEEILDRTREHMVNAWAAIGGGRPLVEHERLGTSPRGLRLLEQLLGVPAR